MAKPSNREQILVEGLRVVQAQGFAGASVRDIVQAAGVPQGSFTNHFASKEAFGLEIIDLYYATSREIIAATLENETLKPLARLEAYIDADAKRLKRDEMRHGCLLGNFAAEAPSKRIRRRLVEIFGEIQAAIAACLKAAVKAGDVRGDLNCNEAASFVLSSLQGAYLLAKAEHDTGPLKAFKRTLFGQVLAPPD